MYKAQIIKDSIGPNDVRLTTFEITYPKFVHNELMTHRLFSRNTASSRAIPYSKTRQQVLDDPVIPVWWGKNQPGMQAAEELSLNEKSKAFTKWIDARTSAIEWADTLHEQGVHKQIVNRIIEPWMWITAIVTATEWQNFFHLRCHLDAQPEIRQIAEMMKGLYDSFIPERLNEGEWHLPYILDTEIINYGCITDISVARCARVSYLTHDGRKSFEEDLKLFERLKTSGHWSPFEHVAQATSSQKWSGNFRGWKQYRKSFENECVWG